MIQINDKSQCCGCNACGDVCPQNAISFKIDFEGFWYPSVNLDKCVNCGLCDKVCPIINSDSLKKNDFEPSESYAAQHKNIESLFDSTSGSAFSAFAEKMYKMKGYVGGAIFNDDYSVSQFISNDKKDLNILRNSKYVQSNAEGFYTKVKQILDIGEKVLVCGLPCQMAALKAFLKKDYDNLLIIDLVCLGVNSPKILRGYLDYLEEKYKSKIIYFKAKNKELGWRQLTTKVVFENGEVLYDTKETSYFTNGFVSTHAFSRPSCYSCKFKGWPRIADISIADLWGAEKIVGKDLDNDLGTSLILINSRKGKQYYESMKDSFKEKNISLDSAIKDNPAILYSIPYPKFDRNTFFQDFNSLKFYEFAQKYITLPINKHVSSKKKFINTVKFVYSILKASEINIITLFKNIHYNLFSNKIKTSILRGKYIVIHKNCKINISKNSTVKLDGVFTLGYKRVKGSNLETRLLVEENCTLNIGGRCIIYYGADIELFKGSALTLGKEFIANINSTIICGKEISIGDNVSFGRDVTVRDNNGNHFISRRTFKNERPIIIGQHSWICEGAIVMPGSKIGVGVIVGTRSIVSGKIPNFSMVSGSPAVIVDVDVYWKL